MAGCGEKMPAQAKGSVDRLEHTEKTLSVLWRLKALHLPFSHTGWLMRVLSSVVQITALPAFHEESPDRLCQAQKPHQQRCLHDTIVASIGDKYVARCVYGYSLGSTHDDARSADNRGVTERIDLYDARIAGIGDIQISRSIDSKTLGSEQSWT